MGPNLITFTDILSPSKSDIFGLKNKMSNYARPQLEEWEGDLQNALHSQMSERIESSSRNVFFLIFFSIFRFFIFSHFSLLQEVERRREKQRRRGQKAFQDSLIFLTLRILKNFSRRIYFLVLAYS